MGFNAEDRNRLTLQEEAKWLFEQAHPQAVKYVYMYSSRAGTAFCGGQVETYGNHEGFDGRMGCRKGRFP